MKSRVVNEIGGQRTFVIVLDPGEEAFAVLRSPFTRTSTALP